ncbi:hypothetical protein CR513_07854, partial [Mucuna pruriens]
MAINAISHENRDVAKRASKREREEGAARYTTDSTSRVEEGAYSSRLNKVESASVAYIEGNTNPHPKPLIIHYNLASQPRVLFIIQVPARPVVSRGNNDTSNNKKDPVPKVTNIAEIGGVTRSGRIFTLESLRNKDPMHVKKDKASEVPRQIVTKGEATEILKLISHSEYEMLDQLHKTPARVSLVSLLINSEGHHNLLLKVLNDAHVAQDITPEKFEGIINNTTASRHLSFSEDEGPQPTSPHRCQVWELMIARVLIDNGSSLNVMPKTTLDKLYSTGSTLKTNSVVVRAFNGSKREVMGEITLPIHIGPTTFDITFQVMDIRPTYNCLLDRPWIHVVGTIPSFLHQKVKFIAD